MRPEWAVDLVDDESRQDAPPTRSRRSWFGWSATSLPIAPVLLLGMLLGPQGLHVLTADALAAVDPALPVALATLGALLGLVAGFQGSPRRAAGAALLSVGATASVVAIGFGVGALAAGESSRASLWVLPMVLGMAAASSLIVPVRRAIDASAASTATLEAEALVSVVVGGLLLAFARQGALLGTLAWFAQACIVVAILGVAGLLLLSKSVALAERRVFAVATLLLVGGAADSLSFSALLGGACAGLLWKAWGGLSRDSLHSDMLYALHPLIALVLVVAGARTEVSSISLGLAAAYAVLRTLGRLTAGAVLARAQFPASGGAYGLVAPGVFGVALSLNAFRALGPDMSVAVSVVVLGTVFSELTAIFVAARGARA
ncbi:MAG: hypothetical protein ABL986_18100 [Vicinamibacterales bacterium]